MGVSCNPDKAVEAGYLPAGPITIVDVGYCVYDFNKPGNDVPCLFVDLLEDDGEKIRRDYYPAMGGKKALETFQPSLTGKHNDGAWDEISKSWLEGPFLCTVKNPNSQMFTDASPVIFFRELINAGFPAATLNTDDPRVILGTRGEMVNFTRQYENRKTGEVGHTDVPVIGRVISIGDGKLDARTQKRVEEISAKTGAADASSTTTTPAPSAAPAQAPAQAPTAAPAASNGDAAELTLTPEMLALYKSVLEVGKPLPLSELRKLIFVKGKEKAPAGSSKTDARRFAIEARSLAENRQFLTALEESDAGFVFDEENETLELMEE